MIDVFRLAALRRGIKLEMLGMKRSGGRRSSYAIVKSELGFKGNRKRVLEQLEDYMRMLRGKLEEDESGIENEYNNNNKKTNEPRQYTRDNKKERTTQDGKR
tara:strand:+ start:18916 stop:19221 length:306 start_codon:yes stop_codon:yes gene_type:complete